MHKNERGHDDSKGGANDKQYDLSWILYLASGYLSFYLKLQKKKISPSNRRLSIKLTA
jgi:hypothetical protein